MEKTITQLETELSKILEGEFGATYMEFGSTQQGDKIIMGPHVNVYVPLRVPIGKEGKARLKEIFEAYYDKISEVKGPTVVDTRYMLGLGKMKEVILVRGR